MTRHPTPSPNPLDKKKKKGKEKEIFRYMSIEIEMHINTCTIYPFFLCVTKFGKTGKICNIFNSHQPVFAI